MEKQQQNEWTVLAHQSIRAHGQCAENTEDMGEYVQLGTTDSIHRSDGWHGDESQLGRENGIIIVSGKSIEQWV